MFARQWSSLPPDAEFSSDLTSLGYFINKDDEVRSIKNEDHYFKYFISRNPRVNDRQRFAMNQAIQAEIHTRLATLGFCKTYLPCGVNMVSEPNVPIFMSTDVPDKSRVVVIFGETHQDLGVLAQRVLGGPGGIDKGSLVSVVKAVRGSSSAPGVILANMGELIWCAAHIGNYVDPELSRVPGNESPAAHVKYFFEHAVPYFMNDTATLDIIGLGDGADVVESYLNCDETWQRIGGRINCFASVGGQFPEWEVKCDGLREFLKDRARAYVPSIEPLGLVLSGASGNPETTAFTSLGCPVFSAGEPQHVETLFIASHPIVLDWLQEVADATVRNKSYKNPVFTVVYSDGTPESSDWDDCKEAGNGGTKGGEADNRSVQKDVAQEPSLGQAENQTQDLQIQCQPQRGVTTAALSRISGGTSGARKDSICSSNVTEDGSIWGDPADAKLASSEFQPVHSDVVGDNGASLGAGGDDVVVINRADGDEAAQDKEMGKDEQAEGDHKYVVVLRRKESDGKDLGVDKR
ncbi:hypothetical protein E0Z10_g4120 [Xylaria hypoxylon]|uniref:Arb2 domain-containing protein n=1 Tax=Xylaria hypoxylon TaxID=37992 RepID=A0A4Z0YLX8_9PEZI|nr:hypothetical protein E0Z10_g4120 [Xylaria hypoxylon]